MKLPDTLNKTFYFYSENNNFDELLSETCIVKSYTKLFYNNHIIINGDFTEQEIGFLVLKYGDHIVNPVVNFKPVAGKDYTPIRK